MFKHFSIAATVALTALVSFSTTTANAQVTVTTTVFGGTLTETFESFPNYDNQPGFNLPNPTDIFGGAASLAGTDNIIYEPSTGATFGLGGGKGNAQITDGAKGLGFNDGPYTGTITFDGTVTQFGGFFNADADNDTVTFEFFDTSSALIDSESFDVDPADGNALNFFGFTSNTAIKRIEITGSFVVMDSLRINGVVGGAAPEPASLALLTLVGGVFVARRRRTA